MTNYSLIYGHVLKIEDQTVRQNVLEKFFIYECTNGNLEGVKYLHNIYDFNSYTIEKGFQKACKNGHLPVIEFIESVHLLYHVNFSWYISSSSNADIEISKHLINIADKIKLKLDEQLIVIEACRNGNEKLFDLMMSRHKTDFLLNSYCLSVALHHPELFKKIQSKYPEKFDSIVKSEPSILMEHYCIENDFQSFKDIILQYPDLTKYFHPVFSSGKFRFIKHIINKCEDFDIHKYLPTLISKNDIEVVRKYIEYVTMRFPDQPIDYKYVIINISHYKEKIFWLLDNYTSIGHKSLKEESSVKYMDNEDIVNIVKYICLRKLPEYDDVLLYLLNRGYIDVDFIINYIKKNSYDNIDSKLIHKILGKSCIDYITRYKYMVRYSYKKNILKRVLNRDLFYFTNDF